MGDLSKDNDYQFDEFKDQITLKHKLLLDSVKNGHQTIAELDHRVKE